jgi:2-polyprenyl-3-methyl-5-hydroxy-6-metoxy-1,4-benzoquinol methylase
VETDQEMVMRTEKREYCPNCGAKPQTLHSGLTDRVFGTGGEWNLSQCSDTSCRLAWLNPRPLESEIGKAYEQYYTHEPQQAEEPDSGTTTFKRMQMWYARLLGCARERSSLEVFFLDGDEPKKVLDVGCGNGARLKRLSALGWQVEGQEVDAAAAQAAIALGLDVHIGSIHDPHFESRKYNAIVSNHVIEHLHNPAVMVSRSRDLLDDDGKLVIITPNISSFGSRLFGRNWRGLEPPRHIQIYSPGALRALLLDCGYRQVTVFTSSARADLIMTGSLDLALRKRHTPSHARPSVANALMTVVLWTMARVSNLVFKNNGEELVAICKK